MLNPQQITSSKRSKPITLHPPIPQAFQPLDAQPRARGEIVLSAKRHGGRSVIDGLRQAGAMKALFPRAGAMLQTICINTAGGVTGGDRLSLTASAGPGAALGLTGGALGPPASYGAMAPPMQAPMQSRWVLALAQFAPHESLPEWVCRRSAPCRM